MNRTEYMDELVRRLSGFDSEVRDEIVSDYEEHFKMGIANGKSEEQICEELGSIDDLVRELDELSSDSSGASNRTQNTAGQDEAEKGKKLDLEEFAENLARGIGVVGAAICKGAGKVVESVSSGTGKFASSFADSAGDIVNKTVSGAGKAASKVADKAGSFAKSVEESFKASMNESGNRAASETEPEADEACDADYQPAEENGSSNTCETDGANTESAAEAESCGFGGAAQDSSSGADGSAENEECCEESEEVNDDSVDTIIVEADCAEITIREGEGNRISVDYRNFGSKNQQMAYRFYERQEGNVLYTGVKRAVTVSSFFGKVACPEIRLMITVPSEMDMIKVKTMSGDIVYRGGAVDELKLEAVSGEIRIEDVLADKISLKTVSGRIDAGNVRTDSISLDSVSGHISYSGASDVVYSKSVSGSQNLVCREADEVTAATISGSSAVRLVGCEEGYTAQVSSVSGSVDLRYRAERQQGVKSGVFTLGNGACRVMATSVSGSVTVADA